MAAPVLSCALVAASLAWGSTPVQEVIVQAPGASSLKGLRQYFGLAPGAPLSRMEIRRGVHALIASGQVEDVVVEVEERLGGAVVIVKAQMASRIARVEVTGLARRHERLVRDAMDLSAGETLRVAALQHAERRAVAALKADGYPEAELDTSLDFDRQGETVAVRVAGRAGPRLLAGKVEAPGAGLDPASLWKATRLRPGARLSQRLLAEARAALLRHLRRAGFWEAEVGQPRVTGPPKEATVTIDVERGPHYRLELRGERLTKVMRREALPFLDGAEGFGATELDGAVAALRRWAQRRGHLLAAVEGVIVEGEDGRVLRLEASFGPRLRIADVRFPGAPAGAEARLRAAVAVRPGRPGQLRGEPVDEETLEADAAAARAALAAAGYAGAEVGEAQLVRVGGGVAVEFPVVVGALWTVRNVTVEGMPQDVPFPPLPLAAGSPWSQAGEELARQTLLETLQEAGYAEAQVWSEHSCQTAACDVRVTVAAGGKTLLGRLVIAGLEKTDPAVVDKVLRLKPGRLLTPESSLAATRRLLALGIFRKATLRPLARFEPGEARDVVLEVAEAPTRSIGFGLGWDTESRANVSLSWSELSLFGTGRSLAFDGRYSSREARWQLTFREPAELALVGVPVWVSVFRADETYETYDLLRRGMWVELGDRRRVPRRALLRYEYEITSPSAPEAILSDLEREHQRARVASLTPILEYDSRDDVFEPHRGVQASLQYQNAFPAFNADAAFHKLTLFASAYTPIRRGVLVGSARLGGIEPKRRVPGTPDNLLLPIATRFFAGGRISHRAFPIDRLGIPGETLDARGNPLGGAGLALVNLEWRFPVAGVVGGAVFVDGGNVWSRWRDMEGRDLRWGAGLGMRVATPIGPIRLEYGWKLDRREGESAGELFFAFGNPF